MFDILIIGGGITGASIARELSKYDLKIGLIEKNPEICQETTKANSAIIHGGYDAKPGTLKAKLNVKGNRMMEKLSKELDFTYKEIGSLVLAFNDEDEMVLEELYKRGIENGVGGLKIISGSKVLELEPKVSKEVKSALYCEEAGIVDPFNFNYGMMENAIENGVKLFTDTEALDIYSFGSGISVKTNNGIFNSRIVINSGGLFSDKIANMAGDKDFKILPTKGVYRLLAKGSLEELNKVLFQTPTKLGKGVLVTPTYEGNTMLGPTSELIGEEKDIEETKSLKVIDELSKKSIPDLDLSKTIRVFTGIRAKPDTGDFMIYPSKNLKGMIHVGGIESPGLTSAPAIAEYVRDIVEELDIVELRKKVDFNPERKGIVRVNHLSKDKKSELIKKDEKYGNIICRCEQVSEGEILESIHRPAGAVTVDGVKKRVRAGMGFCQGNYCRPKVTEILQRELGISEHELKEERSGTDIIEKYFRK